LLPNLVLAFYLQFIFRGSLSADEKEHSQSANKRL
jgi:hypothetical protein